MKCLTVDPQSDPLWNQLVNYKESTLFHSPEWARVLAKTYGFPLSAYVLTENQTDTTLAKQEIRPVAGIQLCELDDIRGTRLSSLPFCDYYDPIVSCESEWNLLVEQVLASRLPYKLRPVRNLIPVRDDRFQMVNRARWHGLDITPTEETIWMRLRGSVRTAVRRARKQNIDVRIAQNISDLRSFYQLHLEVRKYKYGMVAQPFEFFHHIWQELIEPGNGDLLLAVHKNQIIAATIFLYWKDNVYYKFNASKLDKLEFSPNELLLWYGIGMAKERGCKAIDLGLSDWNQDGLIRFKRKFATEQETIYYLQHTPEWKNLSSPRGIDEVLSQLTALLTDPAVPDQITQRAGQILYRFFS